MDRSGFAGIAPLAEARTSYRVRRSRLQSLLGDRIKRRRVAVQHVDERLVKRRPDRPRPRPDTFGNSNEGMKGREGVGVN